MKTDHKVEPGRCSCCEGVRIPLVQSGVFICQTCDGWPPILEPPTPGRPVDALDDPRTGHRQGCGAGRDPGKRCICGRIR